MKKIAIIIASLKFGWGAEKVASTMWSKFYKDWNIVYYFTFYDAQEKYPFEGEYFSLNEHLTENIVYKTLKLFTRAYKIAVFCKKNNIETCLSFMEDSNFSTIISKFFWNPSKIRIAIRHSLFEYWKGVYYWLIKLLYKLSDTIVVMTRYERDNLIKNFGIENKKLKLICNAIDLSNIASLKKESLWSYKDIFTNTFTFITAWRLNKIKNQKLLIDSFLDFNKKYKNTQLIILWDWEFKKKLERQIWKNNNIHLLWNQENVFKFLYNSDCFVLTSFSEAFPNVILESMACWLPIISTHNQWWYEILGNNNYWLLTKNNDKKELFNAMQKIYLDEKSRNHYKQKSLERSKNFEMTKIIAEWNAIL